MDEENENDGRKLKDLGSLQSANFLLGLFFNEDLLRSTGANSRRQAISPRSTVEDWATGHVRMLWLGMIFLFFFFLFFIA